MKFCGYDVVPVNGKVSLRSLHMAIGAPQAKTPGKFMNSARRYRFAGDFETEQGFGICVSSQVAVQYLEWALTGSAGEMFREGLRAEKETISGVNARLEVLMWDVVTGVPDDQAESYGRMIEAVESAINDYEVKYAN